MRVISEIVRDTLAIARILSGDRIGLRQITAAVAHDGAQVLALTRLRQAARRWRIPVVGGVLRRLQTTLFGIDIGRDVKLGEGVLFAHTVGVVIGGDARIGDRVMFLGNNTIGSTKLDDFPSIGSDTIIGAGARILGAIAIGDRAAIGANAVVLSDVPSGASAYGVPAVVRIRSARRGAGASSDGQES